MKKVLLLLLVLGEFGLYGQDTLYVDQQAIGTNDGSSWQNASKDLAATLRAATANDQIWVAMGTYYPTTDNSRDSSFVLKKGTKLFGGFAGNELQIEDRVLEKNVTILSGDIGSTNNTADNSFTVVLALEVDSSNILDGFTISKGNAQGASSSPLGPVNAGGGIFTKSSSPVGMQIRNCSFIDNMAFKGGGLYTNQSLRLFNCSFVNNYADYSGGGIHQDCPFQQANSIRGCTFVKNKNRYQGAGLFIAGNHNKFLIQNCRFDNNKSLNPDGMAMYNTCESDTFSLKNTYFGNHSTTENGVVCYFVAENAGNWIKLDVDSCKFELNKLGGSSIGTLAVLLFDSRYDITVKNSSFQGNKSSYGSFSIEATDSNGKATVENCKFYNNKCNNPNLACIYFYGRGSQIGQNNMYVQNCVFAKNDGAFTMVNETGSYLAYITNCTFYNNGEYPFYKTDVKEGKFAMINRIYSRNNLVVETFFDFQTRFAWNIFRQNSSGFPKVPLLEYYFFNNAISCTDSCQTWWLPGPVVVGNLFNREPYFKDTLNNDFSLLPCSSLINSGDRKYIDSLGISTDLAGNPRFYQDSVDIGAYESQEKCTVGTSALDQEPLAILLKPNICEPAATIHLELDQNFENYQIKIFDSSGQQCSQSVLMQRGFEAPSAPGFYVVQVFDVHKRIVGVTKMVVVN